MESDVLSWVRCVRCEGLTGVPSAGGVAGTPCTNCGADLAESGLVGVTGEKLASALEVLPAQWVRAPIDEKAPIVAAALERLQSRPHPVSLNDVRQRFRDANDAMLEAIRGGEYGEEIIAASEEAMAAMESGFRSRVAAAQRRFLEVERACMITWERIVEALRLMIEALEELRSTAGLLVDRFGADLMVVGLYEDSWEVAEVKTAAQAIREVSTSLVEILAVRPSDQARPMVVSLEAWMAMAAV